MLMVFVSPSASCEQPWALEIAEAQIVRNSHVFFIIPAAAAAPRKIGGSCQTGAAYFHIPDIGQL